MQLFCVSVRVRFVNIIGTDMDLWAFLCVVMWWRLVIDAKEFSFREFDLTILKPIWRQDPPRSVMCFCCPDCLSPPGAFSMWTVAISWLRCCLNFSSLATEVGVSFTTLLDLCPKVSEHITASRDFDVKIRGRFCALWNFSTSSDVTEAQHCLLWLLLCVVVLFLHLNISNVCFLKRLVLYRYNSGLKREFNWIIVSAHRKLKTWRKKGVVSRKR